MYLLILFVFWLAFCFGMLYTIETIVHIIACKDYKYYLDNRWYWLIPIFLVVGFVYNTYLIYQVFVHGN